MPISYDETRGPVKLPSDSVEYYPKMADLWVVHAKMVVACRSCVEAQRYTVKVGLDGWETHAMHLA